MKFNITNKGILIQSKSYDIQFNYKFAVIYREDDPKLAYKRIPGLAYNMPTWNKSGKKDEDTSFMPHEFLLTEKVQNKKTQNIFDAGKIYPFDMELEKHDDFYIGNYENDIFKINIKVTMDKKLNMPSITYDITALKQGYFSVIYLGSPKYNIKEIDYLWQPLIWQEKILPKESYVTAEYQCPIPAVMAEKSSNTFGVLVNPLMMQFKEAFPTAHNSKFGVLLRSQDGLVQPMCIAPLFGGENGYFELGSKYEFTFNVFSYEDQLLDVFRYLVIEKHEFKDLRKNVDINLNETFENMVNYCMDSYYNKWASALKGCSYQTDAPGTVRNTSISHPLGLALVTDRLDIYHKRVIPITEYLISRKNTLFKINKENEFKMGSHELGGPCTSISDLANTYNMTCKKSKYLVEIAKNKFEESNKRWQDALAMYRMTEDETYLKISIQKARKYIKNRYRVLEEKENPNSFFWTTHAPLWQDLLELYEETKLEEFLDAAVIGAKMYCMFIWYTPIVPDKKIVVNRGGKTSKYFYARGPHPMKIAEEEVDAWRVSEIGLTCESSGTAHGHRGIFMTFHAPSLLRLAHYTNDSFFETIARSSVIGRYKNFPGYHMNTLRSTVYEKIDYPYHEFEELTYNTFHYNHALAMTYMIFDYLVEDVFKKSNGNIYFNADYYEGYAYVYNKVYGHKEGYIYGKKAYLYMPEKLVQVNNIQLNYLSARSDEGIYLIFTNQSKEDVTTTFEINDSILDVNNKEYPIYEFDGEKYTLNENLINGKGKIKVKREGITTLFIKGVLVETQLQDKVIFNKHPKLNDNSYCELNTDFGKVSVSILMFSENDINLYAYCHESEDVIKSAKLIYTIDSTTKIIEKSTYPFEFSVPIKKTWKEISGYIEVKTLDKEMKSQKFTLNL